MLLHLLQLQRISSLNSDDSAYAQCYVGSPRETHKSRYVGLCSLNEIKKNFAKEYTICCSPELYYCDDFQTPL